MRYRTLLPAMVMLSLVSSQSFAEPFKTWAKKGVSYEQYRTDAIECGQNAANIDITDHMETKRFVQAFNSIDRENNMPPFGGEERQNVFERTDRHAFINRKLQPNRNIDRLQAKLTAGLHQCLSRLGYEEITLTKHQEKDLKRLKPGSQERHRYLHQIASGAF